MFRLNRRRPTVRQLLRACNCQQTQRRAIAAQFSLGHEASFSFLSRRMVSTICGLSIGMTVVTIVQRQQVRRDFENITHLPTFGQHLTGQKNVRTTFEEAYSIRDATPLGAGSFGDVFSANHKATGALYAVKILDKQIIPRGMVQREVEALQCLDHPNICRMIEYFESDRYAWLVLEHCGEELCDLIMRNPRGLPEVTVADLMLQMLRAVSHCHRHAIIHRDIKPENFLVSENGTVKLIDFGFSLTKTQAKGYNQSFSGHGSGTLMYMSPQLLRRERPTFSDDVWSLGVVLHVLLTGRFPFSTGDDSEFEALCRDGFLESNVNQTLKHLSGSPAASDLLSCLLNFDQEQRYSGEAALQHPFLADAWNRCVHKSQVSMNKGPSRFYLPFGSNQMTSHIATNMARA